MLKLKLIVLVFIASLITFSCSNQEGDIDAIQQNENYSKKAQEKSKKTNKDPFNIIGPKLVTNGVSWECTEKGPVATLTFLNNYPSGSGTNPSDYGQFFVHVFNTNGYSQPSYYEYLDTWGLPISGNPSNLSIEIGQEPVNWGTYSNHHVGCSMLDPEDCANYVFFATWAPPVDGINGPSLEQMNEYFVKWYEYFLDIPYDFDECECQNPDEK